VSRQRYAEAEPLYARAIGIQERALGPNHPKLAEGVVGFASLRKEQGRIAEAIGLYERALIIKERAYAAADHPELTEIRHVVDALRAAT
jgi:tetratricopeptide (TPR) repeat protein